MNYLIVITLKKYLLVDTYKIHIHISILMLYKSVWKENESMHANTRKRTTMQNKPNLGQIFAVVNLELENVVRDG